MMACDAVTALCRLQPADVFMVCDHQSVIPPIGRAVQMPFPPIQGGFLGSGKQAAGAVKGGR